MPHRYPRLPIKLIKHVELVNLFSYIADEEVDVVLSDLKAAMPKKLWEGDDVAAVEDPLLCKGMAVAVDACGLHTSAFVIFIEHMIARAFRELLTEDVAEKEIVIWFMLPIFEILGEDTRHRSI